jgi:hypothetical protein
MTTNKNIIASNTRNTHGVLKHPDRCDPTAPIDHRYEAIIDYMIANPEMKKGQMAEHFGLTGPYFSTLTGSDAFTMRLLFRRNQHNKGLTDMVVSQLFSVTEKALGVVAEKLDEEEVEGAFALSAASTMLRSLGFGAAKGQMPATQQEVHVAAPQEDSRVSVIIEARQRMQQVAVIVNNDAQRAPVIQGELVTDGGT